MKAIVIITSNPDDTPALQVLLSSIFPECEVHVCLGEAQEATESLRGIGQEVARLNEKAYPVAIGTAGDMKD